MGIAPQACSASPTVAMAAISCVAKRSVITTGRRLNTYSRTKSAMAGIEILGISLVGMSQDEAGSPGSAQATARPSHVVPRRLTRRRHSHDGPVERYAAHGA